MFTVKKFQAKSLSKTALNGLESWTIELNYNYTLVETNIHFEVAKLYYTKHQDIEPFPIMTSMSALKNVCIKKLFTLTE